MKIASVASALMLSLAVSTTAFGGTPDFEFTAPGGAIRDDLATAFALTMTPDPPSMIDTLELELTGLTHTTPWDLDIYLIDPFGTMLDVQLDRGDMSAVNDITIIFNDAGDPLPADPDTPLSIGPWQAEGGNLNDFNAAGTDAWILLIVDDSEGNTGSLDSWTLRGTVPEPVTLSLLGLGAIATLRRRKK